MMRTLRMLAVTTFVICGCHAVLTLAKDRIDGYLEDFVGLLTTDSWL